MREVGFFLLALACGPALAEWIQIERRSEDLGTTCIDPETIDSYGASMRRAWQMQDFKKNRRRMDSFLTPARSSLIAENDAHARFKRIFTQAIAPAVKSSEKPANR